MNGRHQWPWVACVVIVVLGAAGPTTAAAQEKTRQQQFNELFAEYQRVIPKSAVPSDAQTKAELDLADRMGRFIEAMPGDHWSFRTIGFSCALKHADAPPAAARALAEHQLKHPDLIHFIAAQWNEPTPGRSAVLKQLVAAPALGGKARGLAALMLARDIYQQASETGDRELARHAERFADQFEKEFPDRYPANVQVDALSVPRVLDAIRKVGVGKAAPKTETQDVLNKAFKMEDLRGKVVLVFFYTGASTQYDRVRAYLEPHLARLKNRPVALVLVGATSPTVLATRVRMDKAPPAAVLAGGGVKKGGAGLATGQLYQDWGVYAFPTAVLVDAQGTVRYRFSAPPGPVLLQEPAFLQRLDAVLDRLAAEAAQK